MEAPSCPEPEAWDLFARGGVDDDLLETMGDHLRNCGKCSEVLDGLGGTDCDLVAEIRGPRSSTVLGRFRLYECLGVGGMGAVYRAFDPARGHDVALKLLLPHAALDPRWRRRFLDEGGLARFDHPHLVRIFEAGRAEGMDYLAMEYCAGPSLARWIESADGPIPPRLAARIVAEVAEGAAFCHEQGVVHRDISPANVLLFPREPSPADEGAFGYTIKLADFGVAKGLPRSGADSLTATGAILGKLEYVAPEVLRVGCKGADPRADVFALGVLLYRLLTGRSPFRGLNDAQTLRNVEFHEPPPPRSRRPEVSRDLETICLKCLEKEPGRRYGSARAAADDLRRFLDGEAISARPVSVVGVAWRWCRRRPAVAALAAALLAALWGGFFGMFLLWRRAEADARRTAAMLGQLIELNTGGRDWLPKAVGPDHAIALLRLARRSLTEFADRMPDREAMYAQRVAVESRLANALAEESRHEELRSLCEDSIRDAEAAIRQHPRIAPLRGWLIGSLDHLTRLAEKEGRTEGARALLARSVACSEDWYRDAPDAGRLAGLVSRRRVLARALARWGRRAEAGALLLANRRAIDGAPADWLDPPIVAERALDPIVSRALGIGPPPDPLAGVDDPRGAIAALGSPEADRMSADAWATSVVRALHFDDPGRPATFREPEAARCFTAVIQGIASDLRRQERLDQAGPTVDRLVAFARLLVDRNPRDPEAHLILADAYEQIAKNAWRVPDRATIRLGLTRAIEEDRLALGLAPDHEVARHQLEFRLGKLDDLLHPR